jgi:hypothetical protein
MKREKTTRNLKVYQVTLIDLKERKNFSNWLIGISHKITPLKHWIPCKRKFVDLSECHIRQLSKWMWYNTFSLQKNEPWGKLLLIWHFIYTISTCPPTFNAQEYLYKKVFSSRKKFNTIFYINYSWRFSYILWTQTKLSE